VKLKKPNKNAAFEPFKLLIFLHFHDIIKVPKAIINHRNGEKITRAHPARMSLSDIHTDVCSAMDEDKPTFIQSLKKHINLRDYLPMEFYLAFYRA
jgi:hypothetical protein